MPETKFYRHYKNKPYKYLGLVRHSETLEELVLYETLYKNSNGRVWVRPKDMFFEKIEKDNKLIHRFEPIYFRYADSKFQDEQQLILQNLLVKLSCDLDLEKLKQSPSAYAQIAYDEEQAVGVEIGFALNASTYTSSFLGILPDYQGLGIGTQLLKMQQEWCRNKKFAQVQTKLNTMSTSQICFYLKTGFKIIGVAGSDLLFEKKLT